ncbi:putative spermidine/putrescine transport system permease protein [Stella humosa]|uniref:Putative spermidine/putrescine transport system permease protein n=1 Tax=Stella humosa TaxID=94 RepID=A0A3N1M9C3_9PROT|nr:ABC transporter permease subunit [Stella humosa]ROQ00283.1 putative spermidine/putrescine transport system permease protein [Stella humosa]BBK30479.1 ABC transporter permease [Stella humosa]
MAFVTVFYLLFLFAPMVLLLVGSFGQSWTNTLLPTGFTGRWYVEVATDPSFRRAFVTSLQVVGLTCVLNVLIGLPLAYAIQSAARSGVRVAARLLTLLPIAVPDLVLAFGFILVFSSDTLPWLGSFWLLVAGHVVLTLPYTVNTLAADMQQLGLAEYEQAAATLGAPFLARFRDVVLPMVATSLLSAMLTVAALSIGEFQLSNLVAGFLSRTYPVVLLQAFYGATGFACAATVVLLVLAVTASVLSSATARLARAR